MKQLTRFQIRYPTRLEAGASQMPWRLRPQPQIPLKKLCPRRKPLDTAYYDVP